MLRELVADGIGTINQKIECNHESMEGLSFRWEQLKEYLTKLHSALEPAKLKSIIGKNRLLDDCFDSMEFTERKKGSTKEYGVAVRFFDEINKLYTIKIELISSSEPTSFVYIAGSRILKTDHNKYSEVINKIMNKCNCFFDHTIEDKPSIKIKQINLQEITSPIKDIINSIYYVQAASLSIREYIEYKHLELERITNRTSDKILSKYMKLKK